MLFLDKFKGVILCQPPAQIQLFGFKAVTAGKSMFKKTQHAKPLQAQPQAKKASEKQTAKLMRGSIAILQTLLLVYPLYTLNFFKAISFAPAQAMLKNYKAFITHGSALLLAIKKLQM